MSTTDILRGLNERLVSIRMETNTIRSEIEKLVGKHLDQNGPIIVPIDPDYAKRDDLSEEGKIRKSVSLDSSDVTYKEGNLLHEARIAGLYRNEEDIVVKGYEYGKVVEFSLFAVVNIEEITRFLVDFLKDPDEVF